MTKINISLLEKDSAKEFLCLIFFGGGQGGGGDPKSYFFFLNFKRTLCFDIQEVSGWHINISR